MSGRIRVVTEREVIPAATYVGWYIVREQPGRPQQIIDGPLPCESLARHLATTRHGMEPDTTHDHEGQQELPAGRNEA